MVEDWGGGLGRSTRSAASASSASGLREPRVGVPPAFVFLAIALLTPGCILTSGEDDLGVVCEQKGTSPRPPYTPSELRSITRVEDGLTDAQLARAFELVSARLLTQGGAPYVTWNAALVRESGDLWRYEGRGTWTEGKRMSADEYVFGLDASGGEVRDLGPSDVDAPGRLRERALGIVASTPEAAHLANATLARAWWTNELPGCITLRFEPDGQAVVNVDRALVVHLANGAPRA